MPYTLPSSAFGIADERPRLLHPGLRHEFAFVRTMRLQSVDVRPDALGQLLECARLRFHRQFDVFAHLQPLRQLSVDLRIRQARKFVVHFGPRQLGLWFVRPVVRPNGQQLERLRILEDIIHYRT